MNLKVLFNPVHHHLRGLALTPGFQHKDFILWDTGYTLYGEPGHLIIHDVHQIFKGIKAIFLI